MTSRVFNDKVRSTLSSKPSFDEIGVCSLENIDPATVPLLDAHHHTSGKRGVFAAISAVCGDTDTVEFAVLAGGSVYLVNTEGYDYPRYCGRMTPSDSARFLEAHGVADA